MTINTDKKSKSAIDGVIAEEAGLMLWVIENLAVDIKCLASALSVCLRCDKN
jgi:hypothetical protein